MGLRGPKPRPLAERFWPKVDVRGPDECWPWTAARNRLGYGQVARGGTGGGMASASRVAFDLAHPDAPLEPHEFACHHCDNPPCCNPAHLFRGTVRDNVRDAQRKGRLRGKHPRGLVTHCLRGHEFTPDNTRYTDGGTYVRRACRACLRIRLRRRYDPAKRHAAYLRERDARRARTTEAA